MLSPQSMFACGDRLEHSSGKHSQKTVLSSMLRMATATVSVSLVSLVTIIRSNHLNLNPIDQLSGGRLRRRRVDEGAQVGHRRAGEFPQSGPFLA